MRYMLWIGMWFATMGAYPFITDRHADLSSHALAWDMLLHLLGVLFVGIYMGRRWSDG
jgi:hypothetical protein